MVLFDKDDGTCCKRTDWRAAVTIATVQPGFVFSCSSEQFFSTLTQRQKKKSILKPSLSLCFAATPNGVHFTLDRHIKKHGLETMRIWCAMACKISLMYNTHVKYSALCSERPHIISVSLSFPSALHSLLYADQCSTRT